MGMDVYGRAPKSEKGGYFRSNIWGWPTILSAIADTKVLPADMVDDMAFNIGAGPDDVQAVHLADALDEMLANLDSDGVFISEETKFANMGTAEIARHVAKILEEAGPKLGKVASMGRGDGPVDFSADVAFIKEFAEFCRDSGGFEVW